MKVQRTAWEWAAAVTCRDVLGNKLWTLARWLPCWYDINLHEIQKQVNKYEGTALSLRTPYKSPIFSGFFRAFFRSNMLIPVSQSFEANKASSMGHTICFKCPLQSSCFVYLKERSLAQNLTLSFSFFFPFSFNTSGSTKSFFHRDKQTEVVQEQNEEFGIRC